MKYNEIQRKIPLPPPEKHGAFEKKLRPIAPQAVFSGKSTCGSEKSITFAPIFER